MKNTHANMLAGLRIVLPMAGKGQRFRDKGYGEPKPLIPVDRGPMLKLACSSLSFFRRFPRENIIAIVRREDEQSHGITKQLRGILGDSIQVLIDPSPRGAATTVLVAKNLINDERPLIVMDCDILFKATAFEDAILQAKDIDGAIPVFKAKGDHWSFSALRDDDTIERIVEKQRISPFANIGCYFFGKGSTFVQYSEKVVQENRKSKGEFYVSTVLNRMIQDGRRILAVMAEQFISLGTPADLHAYLKKQWAPAVPATLPKQPPVRISVPRKSPPGGRSVMPFVLIATASPPRSQLHAMAPGILSAGMTPVNGRPALGWTIDTLHKQGFEKVHVLIQKHDAQLQDYIDWRSWPDSLQIGCEEVECRMKPKGLAHSLCVGLSRILDGRQAEPAGVLVVLGHTIIRTRLPLCARQDWVLYSEVEEETSRWCYVQLGPRSSVTALEDKPKERKLPDKALVGVYYFADARLLLTCLRRAMTHHAARENCPFSAAMDLYMKSRAIQAIHVKKWYDCGSIRGVQRSRRELLAARSFNSIKVDADFGILSKKSKKAGNLYHEYSWYTGVPKEFACIVPRVVEYNACKRCDPNGQEELCLEYYGYNSLEEAWVYQEHADDVWQTVLRHVLSIAERLRAYSAPVSRGDFRSIYADKTHSRLEELKKSKNTWAKILEYFTITVNGNALLGWPGLDNSSKFKTLCEQLYNPEHCTIIHGDLQLANILYDFSTGSIKLLDPRGSFGQAGIFGDCKYDLAKMRHSLHGKYNHIVNDLFHVTPPKDNHFTLIFPERSERRSIVDWFDDAVKTAGFDLDQVKFIEALLFMSMLPLHGDQPRRQLAMFLQGIRLLNEVIVKGTEF
jgi:dTDP-glucose pyrophosphorylase